MIQHLSGIATECWYILAESAPYVLFGFFAAGLLRGLIPEGMVAKHLGSNSTGSVIKASLLGIPLPLCSCGVIPAAVDLRKQGASKGASAAFLISTPESGVDSIAITWALLDPLMTVLRPLAAFVTATIAGLLINRLPDEEPKDPAVIPATCGCPDDACASLGSPQPRTPLGKRLQEGLTYAFGELLADIGKWLLIGIGVAGVISYLLPGDFFSGSLGSGFVSLLLMLVIGIPLYICASASTPIAAALVLKGLSPGAALVFLLAGPATNAATLTVIGKFWGKQTTAVYLACISVTSVLLGWLVNHLYGWSGIDIQRWVSQAGESAPSTGATVAALVLLILIGKNFLPKHLPPGGG